MHNNFSTFEDDLRLFECVTLSRESQKHVRLGCLEGCQRLTLKNVQKRFLNTDRAQVEMVVLGKATHPALVIS